jgi:hypothetical protein
MWMLLGGKMYRALGNSIPVYNSRNKRKIYEGKGQSCPCALTEHYVMKVYWGNGCIAPRILDLGTRWRWMVSFTPRPLYPHEKEAGWAPEPLWTRWWRENFEPLPGLEPPIIQTVARRCTTELSKLEETLIHNEKRQSLSRNAHVIRTTRHIPSETGVNVHREYWNRTVNCGTKCVECNWFTTEDYWKTSNFNASKQLSTYASFNIAYGLRNVVFTFSLWIPFPYLTVSAYSCLYPFILIVTRLKFASNYGRNFPHRSGKCLSLITVYVILWD